MSSRIARVMAGRAAIVLPALLLLITLASCGGGSEAQLPPESQQAKLELAKFGRALNYTRFAAEYPAGWPEGLTLSEDFYLGDTEEGYAESESLSATFRLLTRLAPAEATAALAEGASLAEYTKAGPTDAETEAGTMVSTLSWISEPYAARTKLSAHAQRSDDMQGWTLVTVVISVV